MEERTDALLKGLRAICELDEGRRDLGGILARAAGLAREMLDVPLVYAAAAADTVSLVSVSEAGSHLPRTEPWEGPGPISEAVLQTGEPRIWHRGEEPEPSGSDFVDFVGAGAWLGVPIPMTDRPSGILVAMREDDRPFTGEDQDTLQVIVDFVSSGIANIRIFQEVESLSVTDELTRIYNYRFLKAALQREVERASRYGQIFSILMLDVDRLKAFNEEHGHLGGSELLRQMAMILARQSRAIDLVAKYGGDEFLLILPQTATDGAEIMGNRICQAVAQNAFPYCQPGDITLSGGVASFPQHGASMEALLAAADDALFAAKRNGRNRIETATRPGQPGRVSRLA